MRRIRSIWTNYNRVIENFFSLGLINVLNSSFHLIVYPILIRRVGAEAYGSYVYAFSIISYFTTFATYGLDMIGTRYLAIYAKNDNQEGKSDIASRIISSKFYLSLIGLVVFALLLLVSPSLYSQRVLLMACFVSVIGYIFMPSWYYIGIQKTRIYLIIQLAFKLFLLFAIILFVNDADSITIYAVLMSVNIVLSCLVAFLWIIYKEGLIVSVTSLTSCVSLIKESTPLFLSNLLITVKTAGLNIVIGNMFGMKSLTAFDFSMKIVSAVSAYAKNINTALFPNVSAEYSREKVSKLMCFEIFLGVALMMVLILFAKPIILIMGNGPLLEEILPVFRVMTILIPVWLISGFFIDLVLTANKLNKQVFFNQLISLVVLAIGVVIAINFKVNTSIFSVILITSGLIEIMYLYYLSNKNKVY